MSTGETVLPLIYVISNRSVGCSDQKCMWANSESLNTVQSFDSIEKAHPDQIEEKMCQC